MAMIETYAGKVWYRGGKPVPAEKAAEQDPVAIKAAREKTMAYRILRAHEKPAEAGARESGRMHILFDALISHDITYVGIIQTARASGMTEFPIPYVLTNCHNSLCAVGGTINADDHVFGLSAARKYGGIYVPANQAVIHQYAREKLAKCGGMVLGSDSHTRYGCYGTLAVGEGGGELAKQLLKNTWDIEDPEVVLVYVEGKVPHGIGPHDAAIALVGATFPDGFVKNRILEFAGPGIKELSMDFRTGIDVMTTETSCLSSVWETDDTVQDFYENVGRAADFARLSAEDGACYDRLVRLNLSELESMIALPFHPSKAYTIHELQQDPAGILKKIAEEYRDTVPGAEGMLDCIGEDGQIRAGQGVIGGCAGGSFENVTAAAEILKSGSIGNGAFELSVYPASAPVNLALLKDGAAETLTEAGAVFKPCFCGPCFGAGDTPANRTLSIRHTTRNFPSREGAKPGEGQMAAVALMDARSIAATAANGGILTAATDVPYEETPHVYRYTDSIYEKRCYDGFGDPHPEEELILGPNITDWPVMPRMKKDLLLKFAAVLQDEVTTTDELIPSGETSSYRSNPIRLSEFALSRRSPGYAARSRAVKENAEELQEMLTAFGAAEEDVSVGSCIVANKPGDGSAREQAASCQKVLGGWANLCYEYATKRYRSNCINWGLVPFTIPAGAGDDLKEGSWLYVPGIRDGILNGQEVFTGILLQNGEKRSITLTLTGLSEEEKKILTEGCLMNYYKSLKQEV